MGGPLFHGIAGPGGRIQGAAGGRRHGGVAGRDSGGHRGGGIGSQGKGSAAVGGGPGDQIYVTGELGGSAAALARLAESKAVGAEYSRSSAHFRPQAPVAVGEWLRRRGLPSAMIDVSDGLSTDLEHICQESHVGAEIEAEAIPRARWGGGKAGRARVSLARRRRLRTAVHLRRSRTRARWREFESRGSGGPRDPQGCG